MTQEKFMGKRYDGGRSPLALDPVILAVPEPNIDGNGGVAKQDPDNPLHLAQPGRWTKNAQQDYNSVLAGLPPAAGQWMDKMLRGWGYDPQQINMLSEGKRRKLVNKLTRVVRDLQRQQYEEMERKIHGLSSYIPEAHSYVPGGANETIPGSSEYRGALPKRFYTATEENRKERTRLHARLATWNAGPLKLERAQGSSMHHMLDYDKANTTKIAHSQMWQNFSNCQIVVVENDWGAAVPVMDGEWRVPFGLICWEFRISGVRVLAFTEADQEPNVMWCVYGADGHWVADDYHYELGCPELPRGVPFKGRYPIEFRRVAKMCYDTIRASCIMLDAQVAHQDHVAAPDKLKERRAKEGRSPLRDHYVVRLLHNERRAHVARSQGASTSGSRAPQRGHWRKGTWVHFDDQDSGQVQYMNDGGFIVSKTWRHWHFAGDPNNIIHKVYKL